MRLQLGRVMIPAAMLVSACVLGTPMGTRAAESDGTFVLSEEIDVISDEAVEQPIPEVSILDETVQDELIQDESIIVESVDSNLAYNGWQTEDGAAYWYEDGVKQGTEGRGKEIYDPDSDAWYWLDAVQGGAKAVSKDVYQESNGGKWVRYDENGHMVKGWQETSAGWYYFDLVTGAMAKGKVTIDGLPCWFDEETGIGMNLVWEQVNGEDYYWYENGKRQGYDPYNQSYRGKEIYDPAQNAWFWLDNNAMGKKAVSKDVYQPYTIQGQDTTGKWVRYDATGRMIKGWQTTSAGTYYFDPTTGAMAKGSRTIDGKTYQFDSTTGILKTSDSSGSSSDSSSGSDTGSTSNTVYVTKYGKKYHHSWCGTIKGKSTTALSKSKAEQKGYSPCKDCYK